jgi:quinol-cytochrome oxidoreductase complex cytochrome b subunit
MVHIHIRGKLFGSVGVVILLLMILTAFLGVCVALGTNELLGGHCYFTNLSTAIPLIRD